MFFAACFSIKTVEIDDLMQVVIFGDLLQLVGTYTRQACQYWTVVKLFGNFEQTSYQ